MVVDVVVVVEPVVGVGKPTVLVVVVEDELIGD